MENNKDKKPYVPLTKEQQEAGFRMLGFFASLFGKVMLEAGGCVVDFKINGENITDIEKLQGMEISAKLKLAIEEERYEDAVKLRDILKLKNRENK
ncbi:MAG: hypothetical protein AABY22_24330 [Nanoarchaeota archaeon]